MELYTESPYETQEFGRTFATSLKGGEILALRGELGSGKTTFVQGLAIGLGIKDRVISPSFILMRKYTPKNIKHSVKINLYHIDLYRLDEISSDEINNLGINDLWRDKENIVIIEWAEKISKIKPKSAIWIVVEVVNDTKRKIVVS